MTELIKRYMEETGGRAESFNDIYMPVYQRDFLNWIMEQLTWRPVGYPPKVDGEYLCRWAGSGCFIALYKNKTWLIWDDELEEHVKLEYLPYMYLPIPPAPKGD